jgi:hypothetical protein
MYIFSFSCLDNAQLESCKHFSIRTANIINGFIENQVGPLCLIAHNGAAFDLPILQHAFAQVHCSLPPNIFFCDSLHAFRALSDQFGSYLPMHVNDHKLQERLPATDTFAKEQNPESVSVTRHETSPSCARGECPKMHTYGSKKVSYALGAVYRRLFCTELPLAHSAEGDCLAMVQIFHLKHGSLLSWIDDHCVSIK